MVQAVSRSRRPVVTKREPRLIDFGDFKLQETAPTYHIDSEALFEHLRSQMGFKKTLHNATVTFVSKKAAGKVMAPEIKGEPPLWVPYDAVHEDSEVWWTREGVIRGRSGKLVLEDWFAQDKGLGLD